MENENENSLEIDLDKIEEQTEEKLKVKDRFAKLSEKMTLTRQEKEAAEAKAKAEAEKAAALARERDFYKDFASQATKYPNAAEYQDKIFEKVKTGYTTADAIVATLVQEGKFGVGQAPIVPPTNVAGGSASNAQKDGEKEIDAMSVDEKLQALKEAEKRGDLRMT